MKLSIVIPAFNEQDRIGQTLQSIRSLGLEQTEIIVIDDGSVDLTRSIAGRYADVVLKLDRNRGKGYALQTGWHYANGTFIACLDADLESSVVEFTSLVECVMNGEADVAVSMITPGKKAGTGFVKRRVQSLVFQKTGVWLQAPLSGQRVFHRRWLPVLLKNKYTGFGIETQMTIDLLNAGAVCKEIPTTMTHREMGKSLKGFVHRLKQWIEIEKQLRGAGL